MRRPSRALALVLAASMPLSACTTAHFYGEYHPRQSEAEAGSSAKSIARKGEDTAKDVVGGREQQPVLATGNNFTFLWGTLNTGSMEVDDLLSPSVKQKTLKNVSVEDRISLAGVVLWIFTVGIFSHHSVIVRGDVTDKPAIEGSPAPAPATERP